MNKLMPLQKRTFIPVVLGIVTLSAFIALSSASVHAAIREFGYTFNDTDLPTLLEDEFTNSITGDDFAYNPTDGISGTGAIDVEAKDTIWTSKREFAVPAPGETYTMSAFFRNASNDGLGSIGFTTEPENDLASGPWFPTPSTGLGMGFHGGGGVFMSDGTAVDMPNWAGGDVTDGWYQMKLEITAKEGALYDMHFMLYPSDSDGNIGTLKTEHTVEDVSNPTFAGADKLYAFFATTVDRFDRVDNMSITGTSISPADNIVIGANNDKNGDGILDSTQLSVSAVISDITGKSVVLEVSDTCAVESLVVKTESGYVAQDENFEYPNGLMDFTTSCGTPGFTTQVTLYYYGVEATGVVARKYNPLTQTYAAVPGAVITTEEIYGEPVTKLVYSVTDGGPLDADGVIDGNIVDPAGLAVAGTAAAVVGVPNTGIKPADTLLPVVLLVVGSSLFVVFAVVLRQKVYAFVKK